MNGVALHWLDLDALDADEAALDADQRAAAARLLRPQVRHRFVARRCALRRIAGSVAFRPSGEPWLPGSDRSVSTSHRDRHGVIALAEGARIGIDVERIGAVRFEDASGWLHDDERELAGGGPASLTRLWTAREAWLKVHGLGLAALSDAPSMAALARCGEAVVGDVRLRAIEAPRDYAAVLAMRTFGCRAQASPMGIASPRPCLCPCPCPCPCPQPEAGTSP
jgi:phosphopantetheinyl transferase